MERRSKEDFTVVSVIARSWTPSWWEEPEANLRRYHEALPGACSDAVDAVGGEQCRHSHAHNGIFHTPSTPQPFPDMSDAKVKHIFTDPATWLSAGLFIHSPITSPHDLKHLKDLVMLLAAVPENIQLYLPGPPPDAADHVRFAWGMAQRMVQHFARYASTQATYQTTQTSRDSLADGGPDTPASAWSAAPSQAGGAAHSLQPRLSAKINATRMARLERPGLQMLWVLLDQSIAAVTHPQNARFPERKRLGLFAAVAFAHRLELAAGKAHEPKWLVNNRRHWKPECGAAAVGTPDEPGLGPGTYLRRTCSAEAWAYDQVTEDKHSVLEDTVRLEVAGGMEPAPLPHWGAVAQVLEERGRLLLVGGPGSGRSLAARAVLAHVVQEQLASGDVSRLPLRVSVGELARLCLDRSLADPLQEHIVSTADPDFGVCLSWATPSPPPWTARSGHQVVATQDQLVLLGGLSREGRCLGDAWASKDGGHCWEPLPGPPWSARHGHQAVVFNGAGGETILLCGGTDENQRMLRDVWESRDAGMSWHQLPDAKWKARCNFQMLVAPLKVSTRTANQIVIVGGLDTGHKPLQDAWVSDDHGLGWKELERPAWPARCGHQAVLFQDNIFVMGGQGEGGAKLNDVWFAAASGP
ncbi:unnamed protein product [Prorocentrum cordatum]|uniref:DUF6242 domain-containing protein n=1 Tax=Prorocentrum cordatum TaxID=2364126 RepID=A0ABN9R794_9DINO|nr:unnamed protein product [Polarella glacialis]